jgi:DNA mismatch repair protein MSH5
MLSSNMFVNVDTLESLQILRVEYHPNGQMRGPDQSRSGSKESLSIYGLIASAASTTMGKDRLRKMFLRPTVDVDVLIERQDAIAVLLRHENGETVGALRKMLGRIKSIKGPLQKLRKGVLVDRGRFSVYWNVWFSISQFAMHCVGSRRGCGCACKGGYLLTQGILPSHYGNCSQVTRRSCTTLMLRPYRELET